MKYLCRQKNKIAFYDDCIKCGRRCERLKKLLPLKEQKKFYEWFHSAPLDWFGQEYGVSIEIYTKVELLDDKVYEQVKKIYSLTEDERMKFWRNYYKEELMKKKKSFIQKFNDRVKRLLKSKLRRYKRKEVGKKEVLDINIQKTKVICLYIKGRKMKKLYTIKVREKRKTLNSQRSYSKRRILHFLSTIKWKIGVSRVYIKVNYGIHKNCYDKHEVFDNEGIYNNKKDLLQALTSFDEIKEKDFL